MIYEVFVPHVPGPFDPPGNWKPAFSVEASNLVEAEKKAGLYFAGDDVYKCISTYLPTQKPRR